MCFLHARWHLVISWDSRECEFTIFELEKNRKKKSHLCPNNQIISIKGQNPPNVYSTNTLRYIYINHLFYDETFIKISPSLYVEKEKSLN